MMKRTNRSVARRAKGTRRMPGYYHVPNTNIVLVVDEGKIVTVKRLEWVR